MNPSRGFTGLWCCDIPGWQMLLCAALVLNLAVLSGAAQSPVRERVAFNAEWRFAKDDPEGTGDTLSYSTIRDWVLPTGVSSATEPNLAGSKRPAGISAPTWCTPSRNLMTASGGVLRFRTTGPEGPGEIVATDNGDPTTVAMQSIASGDG